MNFLFYIILSSNTLQTDTSQKDETAFYYQAGENFLCSSSFSLVMRDKDSLYFQESGCEGNSSISYGRFSIRNNIIEFFPREIPYLYGFRVDTMKSGGITLKLVDVNEKALIGQEVDIYTSDDVSSFLGFYSKDSGLIHTQLNSLSSFRLGIPYKVKKEWSWIGYEINVPCLMTLYFNMPRSYLIYPHMKVVETPKFKYVIKENGFYDLNRKKLLFKKETNPDDFWRSHVKD